MVNDVNKNPFSVSTDKTAFSLRQALPQVLAVCAKNVLLLGFGMTLGFPTILIPNLSQNNRNEKFSLGQEAISWIGSINLICVPIGCLFSGVITQPIGRKRAMQFVNVPFLGAWLLFYFSTDVWQVFLALSITGVAGGLLEAPVLTYVAEITQPHLRGMLSSTSTMAVIMGILIQFLLGTFLNWRKVALVSCVVPLISFVSLIFVPETPMWLISKKRYLDARKSIAWLRGWTTLDEIELEFQELCQQLGKAKDIGIDEQSDGNKQNCDSALSNLDKLKLFTAKNFLWPFSLVSFSFFLLQFNGMTTLQTYAIKIFSSLKSPINEYYATVILGSVELLGCVVCVTLIHITGKRLITFISLVCTGSCFFIVATYANILDLKYLNNDSNQSTNNTFHSNEINSDTSYNWVPVSFLILSAFTTHIGIRILPWVLTGEVFSIDTRASASGFSGAVCYIFGFITNKIFLSLVKHFTLPGTFWFYSFVNFAGMLILYFILPETEGKTLYDINEHFSGKSKLGNDVLRRKDYRGKINEGFCPDDINKTVTSESRL